MLSGKPTEAPHLIVQALIRKNTGQYLAIKRASGVETGTWEFPGGRVDPGETLEKALEREVMEETNLKVEIERFVGWGHGFSVKAIDGRLIDRFVMFFECKLIKGKLRFNHETAEHEWLTLEEFMDISSLSKPVNDFFRKFRLIPKELLTSEPKLFKTGR